MNPDDIPILSTKNDKDSKKVLPEKRGGNFIASSHNSSLPEESDSSDSLEGKAVANELDVEESSKKETSGQIAGVVEEEAVERGVSEAAAALEAVIHSAAQVAQTEQAESPPSGLPPLISAEVAFEAQKADLVRQRACVAYLREMQCFGVYVSAAIEDMRNLLHSKTVTDVLEAIEFFLTAKQNGVRNLDAALRHMMAMIWSQEEQIRKAVLDAFRWVFPLIN